jgi:hypothetical protein
MAAYRRTAMPALILHPVAFPAGRALLNLWKRFRNSLSRGGVVRERVSMRLGAGQQLRLQDAAGWTIACLRGSLWLTQEADTRDVFLDAGDNFMLDRNGVALILARQESQLAIRPPVTNRQAETARAADLTTPDSAREVWLRAMYPECGPWNDPAAYRRSGLL